MERDTHKCSFTYKVSGYLLRKRKTSLSEFYQYFFSKHVQNMLYYYVYVCVRLIVVSI